MKHYALRRFSQQKIVLKVTCCLESSLGCKSFDRLLDGGLFTGELTEVYGMAGVGKTQMALTFASSVIQEPRLNVFYIDTTSSFVIERFVEVLQLHATSSPQKSKILLSRLHCLRVFDPFELIANLEDIKERLESEHDPFCVHLKAIVIDSIASLITPILGGQNHGHAIMSKIALMLKEIADEFSIAVLIVNNAVANYKSKSSDTLWKPALGKSWAPAPSVRLYMEFTSKHNERKISIQKHTRLSSNLSTVVCIRDKGISSPKNTKEE